MLDHLLIVLVLLFSDGVDPVEVVHLFDRAGLSLVHVFVLGVLVLVALRRRLLMLALIAEVVATIPRVAGIP